MNPENSFIKVEENNCSPNDAAANTGKEKRIPRPPNAFMIFGQQNRRNLAQQYPDLTNKQISKILGNEWQNMRPETKHYFHRLSEEAYAKHMQKYPGYYYSPLEARQRKAERKRKFMLQRCVRRGAPMSGDIECSNNLVAVQALPQMEVTGNNDLHLIPVYCHHTINPIQQANQTLISISLAPIDHLTPPKTAAINAVDATAIRHSYGDVGFEEASPAPSIYHVSNRDPNFGEIDSSEQFNAQFKFNVNEAEAKNNSCNEFSELMSNYLPPMDNPCIHPVVEVGSNREPAATDGDRSHCKCPKVIVKKEPCEDDTAALMLSSVMDVLSSE